MPPSRALATLLSLTGLVFASVACSTADDDAESAGAADTPEPEPAAEDVSDGEPLALEIELDDGWTLAEGTGYEIGLPPGWFDARRALNDDDFMDELTSGLSDLADDDDVRDMFEEGVGGRIDLLAVRTADLGEEFATNFNVIVEARGPMDEPEVLREMAPDLLASIGADVTEVNEYEVRGIPNVEITYDVERPAGVVVGMQNYLFTDDAIYVATYTAVEPERELWQSVLETFTPHVS